MTNPALLALPAPSEAARTAELRWQACLDEADETGVSLPSLSGTQQDLLLRVWACSEFVAGNCARHPDLVADLVAGGDLDRSYPEGAWKEQLAALLQGVTNESDLMAMLRWFRRREMVRIAWRDIAGYASLEETVSDLSGLAEAVLDASLEHLYQWQCREQGVPVNRAGRPQRLVVIGMGKLGAGELNFSSDIDLIFAFPERGSTRDGPREISNEQFFTRLGQRLINVLHTQTPDGFVFRVDMRLRPFGASGPLATSFDAMEGYYQQHGRDWERYAWIKARVVAGDLDAGGLLMERLRPFVYRRYLDYGAFESLREMKTLVNQEVKRKGLGNDVKLGPGGIREVEFTAQAFQLIRGGRDPALREQRVVRVLDYLAQAGHLSTEGADQLKKAYRFLRNTEHRLQEYDDRQTQALPEDDPARLRLAYSMGFEHWHDFHDALERHRHRVDRQFQEVFAAPEEAALTESPVATLWSNPPALDQAREVLGAAGFQDPEGAWEELEKLRGSYSVRHMSDQARQRLDRFMPALLEAAAASPGGSQTLRRLLDLVTAIARRSVYLVLLTEHPPALQQLVSLCDASPWIAGSITRSPLLMDELLDPRTLYAPPDRTRLERELDEQLRRVEAGDTEQEMDALRTFKQVNVLRVAAADISGALPLMRVSDHLTDIAEVLLDRVRQLAWRDLARRYGVPHYQLNGERHTAGLAIAAYGKLGGIELGYGSDLDIVFLHDSRGERQVTDGDSPIDNNVFFSRLGKRMVHLLTTHTRAGTLYEIDFRLRPSGASGMLVSSMDTFRDYQANSAWTWEHQALVRARVVCGEASIREEFEAVRRDTLARERDTTALRGEVREMRERMRRELADPDNERFDLKQGPGGIADIEFMVQYMVLLRASEYASVLRYTDNIRILETLGREGLLPREDVSLLMDAYQAYRAQGHRLSLQERKAVVDADKFLEFRDGVSRLWARLMED